MIRKWLTGLTLAVVLQAFGAGIPRAGAAETGLFGQVTVKQTGGRNWVVEALVVAALSGAALYAICKSSRRV